MSANSVNLDQTLRSVTSDLGLHCLPKFLLWDDRHKCVKLYTCMFKIHGDWS